VFPSLIVLWLY